MIERFAGGLARAKLAFVQFLGLVTFVVLADILQELLFAIPGWVQFFGGRLAVFNHLVAGGFYTTQFFFLLLLRSHSAGPPVRRTSQVQPQTPEYLLVSKRNVEVPLAISDIDYLKACGNYTEIYAIRCQDRRHLLVLQGGEELPVGRTYLKHLRNLR